ncbi:MAG: hypothetical protein FOGNACKC_03967 [Anaerolineae bacterium]|nr:hypothetical protein [Anaerolineae bacterium]
MTDTSILKRSGLFLLDVLEIYLPTLSFVVLFVVFILQVFFRYFLNNPLTWPPEVISIAFIWTTVLGACYAQRQADHVNFSLIYDRLSPMGQLIFRLIGNSFIAIAFIIALKPTYDYITFMNFQKSTVLRISYAYIFSPYLVFLVLIAGRMLASIWVDVQLLRTQRDNLPKEVSLPVVEQIGDLLLDKDTN